MHRHSYLRRQPSVAAELNFFPTSGCRTDAAAGAQEAFRQAAFSDCCIRGQRFGFSDAVSATLIQQTVSRYGGGQ